MLLALPVELIVAIAENCSRPDLSALYRTNKDLNDIIKQVLYRYIDLKCPDVQQVACVYAFQRALLGLYETLEKDAPKAELVQRFDVSNLT